MGAADYIHVQDPADANLLHVLCVFLSVSHIQIHTFVQHNDIITQMCTKEKDSSSSTL